MSALPVNGDERPSRRGRGRPRRYHFDELGVDEYLYIPGKGRGAIASSIRAAQLRTGFKLRTVSARDGIKIYRVS